MGLSPLVAQFGQNRRVAGSFPYCHKLRLATLRNTLKTMDENLLPKEGSATSSFKVAALSALAPIGLAVVLVIGAAFTPHADVRAELLGLLKYLVSAGIIGGAGVAVQYVYQRGKVSVAKLETYKAINAAPSAQSVTTTTEVK